MASFWILSEPSQAQDPATIIAVGATLIQAVVKVVELFSESSRKSTYLGNARADQHEKELEADLLRILIKHLQLAQNEWISKHYSEFSRAGRTHNIRRNANFMRFG